MAAERALAPIDGGEELGRSLHLPEREKAPLQEIVQHRKTGHPRGPAHHRERRADERLLHVRVETGADLADQSDLPRARRPVAGNSVRPAVFAHREDAVAARQSREEPPVELVREYVEFGCFGDRLDHACRKHPRQDGQHAREVGVALREVLAAVEIGQEEGDRVRIARLPGEIGVGDSHAARLPLAKPMERAAPRRLGAPLGVQFAHAPKRALEPDGRAAGIQRKEWRERGSADPGRVQMRRDPRGQSLAGRTGRPLVCLL